MKYLQKKTEHGSHNQLSILDKEWPGWLEGHAAQGKNKFAN